MNEREFAQKLTRELNRAPLSDKTSRRLRNARMAAADHAAAQPATLVTSAGSLLSSFWYRHHAASIGFLLALMLAVGGYGWQWHQASQAERSLETQLMLDELPMDLFLNEQF